ncbi:MAG: hypothetical protein IJ301_02580 [Clostridia bacterium]|nr:hypothetical protein [Clostridia bacterium]
MQSKSTKITKKTQKNCKKFDFLQDFGDFQVISPKNTFIEKGARIGKNCIIYPNVYIDKNCIIGENTIIYSNTFIEGMVCENGCEIGPSAHIRKNTKLGKCIRLGNFCEVKNSVIGDNTKIAHLSYVGDAVIGSGCNIGCGVVFANYDGVLKHKTFVGNNCFVGCNVNIIAPRNIGNNCFIGAGTTLTKDLKNNAFAVARAYLNIKENNGFNKE